MPRTARKSAGGVVYHCLNRGNGRQLLFHKPADYDAFLALLAEVKKAVPGVLLLAYCLMPNHWHLVLLPRRDGDLSRFMQRLLTAHVRRHHAHHGAHGSGHLYQGRFKSFPVQQDDYHLLTLLRYVESNPLRGERPLSARRGRGGGAASRRVRRATRWACWTNGRWTCRRTGRRSCASRWRTGSARRCWRASAAGGRTGRSAGRSVPPSGWAWPTRCGRGDGRGRRRRAVQYRAARTPAAAGGRGKCECPRSGVRPMR